MAEAFEEDRRQAHAPESGIRRRILIVEDDRELAALLARWVRDHYQNETDVRVANSVEEGAAIIAELPTLDIVLLDRHFPQGTGEDMLTRLQNHSDPIVVMITGVEPSIDLIRLPVADYLVKPIEREGLVKRLALLEKLERSGALDAYANARKASLLEFHLDDPEGDPLFRRFAARWSYDRLEAASNHDSVFVYELYLKDEDGQRDGVDVSIVGTLSDSLTNLVERGELVPVGELVSTGDGHAWIDIDRSEVVDPPDEGYVIYEFSGDIPERFVESTDVDGAIEFEHELAHAFG